MSNFNFSDITKTRCNRYTYNNIKINPVIYSLTPNYVSIDQVYTIVNINGSNFLPDCYVNFGTFQNIPVTYNGSNNISFEIPYYATTDSYNVLVVNKINNQLLYSNSVIFNIQ